MASWEFGAFVTAAAFEKAGGAVFALGDGTVRTAAGGVAQAHDGAVLAAVAHPSGAGLVTGGDDGRVVWTRDASADEIAQVKGRWIDAVAASPASGLIAFAAGRDLHVRDTADAAFEAVFSHDRTVAGLAFDPKGRRIAVATYGGAALWYARIKAQKPAMLAFAGSHIGVAFSPDGKFLISSMQENQLHGWRLGDGEDMRMGGYPAKVKSMTFLAKGMLMATSGAQGAVVWPFSGAKGPMGQSAIEIGAQEAALSTVVAGAPDTTVLAAGYDDGRIWVADLKANGVHWLKAQKGPQITALAISPDGAQLAWGDEAGGAGVADVQL